MGKSITRITTIQRRLLLLKIRLILRDWFGFENGRMELQKGLQLRDTL